MKNILLLALLALSLSLHAQNEEVNVVNTTMTAPELKFGFVSYSALIEAMPEYATAMRRYTELEEKYAAETKRVEDEFNAKY